ncbi:unnamed protein product [Sphacelaria rigidula]
MIQTTVLCGRALTKLQCCLSFVRSLWSMHVIAGLLKFGMSWNIEATPSPPTPAPLPLPSINERPRECVTLAGASERRFSRKRMFVSVKYSQTAIVFSWRCSSTDRWDRPAPKRAQVDL